MGKMGKMGKVEIIRLTQGVPETGFLRYSVGENEVFSSKNPVSLVGCVN
jgi:hypothetical protein